VSQPRRICCGTNFFWSHRSAADLFRETVIGLWDSSTYSLVR
jgi:hypothetical protein